MRYLCFFLLNMFIGFAYADPDCSDYDPTKNDFNSHVIVCQSILLDGEYSTIKQQLDSLLKSYINKKGMSLQDKNALIYLMDNINQLDRSTEKYGEEECFVNLYGNSVGGNSLTQSACEMEHKAHTLELFKKLLKNCKKKYSRR